MDLSPELFARLYSAAPEDFLDVRRTLVEEAKQAGDVELARRITAQRKPTLGAWIVNRQVHAEPDRVDQLVDLGARLRSAHEDLDAAVLRDLSVERRSLVTELTAEALARADRPEPPVALRDDVTATFDAAVADPQIAARLGRLTRPEHWSGFGVAMDAPTGPPELTVIRGGRSRSTSTGPPTRTSPTRTASTASTPGAPSTPAEDGPKDTGVAARRRARRARDQAAVTFETADAELRALEDTHQRATERVHELGAELSRIQNELEATKQGLEQSRRDVKSARKRRREARSALDRAERQVERTTD